MAQAGLLIDSYYIKIDILTEIAKIIYWLKLLNICYLIFLNIYNCYFIL
jgi:hypothetical protein